jgi:hypothetical protein
VDSIDQVIPRRIDALNEGAAMRRSGVSGRQLERRGHGSRSRGLAVESLEPRLALAGLTLSGPTQVVFEGEQAVFTLQLAQRSSKVESVFVTTTQGSATLGVDYMAPAKQQILFAPGQLTKTFSIPTLKDTVPKKEGQETFVVTATPANPALAGPLSRQVRIVDFVAKPTISVGNVTVTEGDSGSTTATFAITLSAAYPRDVTVTYATRNGSATVADGDFTATSGSLTFGPGETRKTVDVAVNGDRNLEPNETFSLVISSAVNGTVARPTGTCTIVNDEIDKPGFQITVNFIDSPQGPVPAAVQSLALEAANRWSQILTGDLPGTTVDTIFIDDLEMTVQMGLLGGAANAPGGVLANAAPTAFRDGGTGLPYAGITGIDPQDAQTNTTAQRRALVDVITHEMGHALGFTPGAAVYSRWIVGTTFVGPNAVREYRSLFQSPATGVPLQSGSSAHWDEATFGNELMTPSTDLTGDFISRVTIGALQDMGYTVSYAAAEAYEPPTSPLTSAVSVAAGDLSNDVAAPPTSRPSRTVTSPKVIVVVPPPATTSPSVNSSTRPTVRRSPLAVTVAGQSPAKKPVATGMV